MASARVIGALRACLPAAVLIALCLFSYSNTFSVPFQADEVKYLLENPFVKDPSMPLEDLRPLPEIYKTLKQRYVAYLTFAANYRLHGFRVEGYHYGNLAIHTANALLVYLVVLLSFRTPLLARSSLERRSGAIAFFTAALFAAHPLQTEAVTYVMQRLASLVALFYLLAIVLYVRWKVGPRQDGTGEGRLGILWYGAALVTTVLAMKTKENAFTLPVVIALYDLCFFPGPWGKRVLRLAPFLLTLLIIPLTTAAVLAATGRSLDQSTSADGIVTGGEYLLTQFRVIVTYLRLLVLPTGQNFVHAYDLSHSLLDVRVLLSASLLLVIFSSALLLLRLSASQDPARRLAAFGMLWFFITLSVESSLVPLPNIIAEYRVYLPSAGFFLAVTVGLHLWSAKAGEDLRQRIVAGALTASVLAGSGLAYARNSLWKDNVTLWEDVVRKSPGLEGPHNNLGAFYDALGRQADAEREFNTALRIAPGSVQALRNLIMVYIQQARFAEAEAAFARSLTDQTDPAWGCYYLGTLYRRASQEDRALMQLKKAIILNPGFADAYFELGSLLLGQGRTGEAIKEFEAALKHRPDYPAAAMDLAGAYVMSGRPLDAERVLEVVLHDHPGDPDALYNMGIVRAEIREQQGRGAPPGRKQEPGPPEISHRP